MRTHDALEAGRKVSDDCAWVAEMTQALDDECRRTTEECDRVHSIPLEGVDEAARRFDAIGAMAQAREELSCFLDDLSPFGKRSPPLAKLRERHASGETVASKRFRNRDLALAATFARDTLAIIGPSGGVDHANPPPAMLLLVWAIHQARRGLARQMPRAIGDPVPHAIFEEICGAMEDPEVRGAWIGRPGSDDRPGPWRASNVLVGRLTGVSWTLVRDAREAASRTTER